MNVRGPSDFDVRKDKKREKKGRVFRIRRILEERISSTGKVWVTAEVYKKKRPIHGVLCTPTDREWMIEVAREGSERKTEMPNRTGRRIKILKSVCVQDKTT